jgi:flagellar motor switch protein FliM
MQRGEALHFSHFVRTLSSLLQAPADTDMLRFRIALKFGRSDREEEMSLLIPLNALEVLQAGDDSARHALKSSVADRYWRDSMIRAAAASELPLTCVLARIDLSVAEIGNLQPGSVVPLPTDMTMAVELRIDQPDGVHDQPGIIFGRLGAASGKRAIRLSRSPEPALLAFLDPVAKIAIDRPG